jgi:hypothetical protein
MSLNQSPEIVRIANTLGIYQHPQPVEAIVGYCLKRVDDWVQEMGGSVDSLSHLERIICAKLRLKFEYIRSDEDIDRIRTTYMTKGEAVIKNILADMEDNNTFGAVFQRKHATARDRDLYVSIIDCRGDKVARKFFTKWHEVAHLLSLKTQLEFVLHRKRDVKPPEEQLMDVIAGRVGFYPSIFRRAFDAELAAYGRFSFGFVQRVRDNVCPDASFHATLNACLNAHHRPTMLVRVEYGLTKAEQDKVAGDQARLFPEQMPIPVLRAVSVQRNEAARESKFSLHQNMRIPDDSVIYRAFQEREFADAAIEIPQSECMAIWRHSDGRGIATHTATIYARPHGQALLALMIADAV